MLIREVVEIDEKLRREINYIDTHCSDAVAAYRITSRILYRGIKSFDKIIKGKSLSYREPVDTEPITQELVDKMLSGAGFKALRSNSIFCTPEVWDTKYYGEPYILFPENGFEYTWSRKIRDFYSDIDDNLPKAKEMNGDFNILTPEEFVSKYGFTMFGFNTALSLENEILIHGKYVAVKLGWVGKDVLRKLDIETDLEDRLI